MQLTRVLSLTLYNIGKLYADRKALELYLISFLILSILIYYKLLHEKPINI